MKLTGKPISFAVSAAIFAGLYLALPEGSPWKQASTWQRMASPGDLSHAHALSLIHI